MAVTAHEYEQGCADGRVWREQDTHDRAYWLETFRAEVETARVSGSRGLRAYYLGVMRGYREETERVY